MIFFARDILSSPAGKMGTSQYLIVGQQLITGTRRGRNENVEETRDANR